MTDTIEKDLQKKVRSYVSFALALKPSITLQRTCNGEALADTAVRFSREDRNTLVHSEVASLEALIKRYEPLKKYLHITDSAQDSTGFAIDTCMPMVTFQPGVEYQMVRINAEQLEVAKQVSQLVDKTYRLHISGDKGGAKAIYDRLVKYVEQRRADLLGDFGNIHKFSEVVGMQGVGRNGNPRADGDCGGAVIFVIIEIFVA